MLSSDGRNPSTMRLLYYPPVPPEDEDPCVHSGAVTYTRCGAHADYGTFTLLAQDSEGGLEVGALYRLTTTSHLLVYSKLMLYYPLVLPGDESPSLHLSRLCLTPRGCPFSYFPVSIRSTHLPLCVWGVCPIICIR